MYEMKQEYYTGIESIDQEHARLFELAQETQDLLDNDLLQDKTDSLFHLISELINYTRKHFSHEEEYQKSIGYAGLKQHAAQHRAFEDRLMAFDLESIKDDYEKQNETVNTLLNFLVNWLVNHILEVDMKYVEAR